MKNLNKQNLLFDHQTELLPADGSKCLEKFNKVNEHKTWSKEFASLLIKMKDWYSTRCNIAWKIKSSKSSRLYLHLQASRPRTKEKRGLMLPTPTTVVSGTSKERPKGQPQRKSELVHLIAQMTEKNQMLPTHMAFDWMPLDKTSAERNARGEKRPSGASIGSKLIQDKRITDFMKEGSTSKLNPLFVEEMMGFPYGWTIAPFILGEKNKSRDCKN